METPSHFDSPAHWRQRAQEAQRIALDFKDAKANLIMRDIIEAYARLAELLEAMHPSNPSAR